MKKTFKILGILLGVIVILLGIGATFVQVSGIPRYEVNAPELQVKTDSNMVAEGKRLAVLVCNNCHMAKNGKLEGHILNEIPAAFGKVWSANITQDTKYGIGNYTDGELAYFLRTGIKRDGNYAPPWMLKFPLLSDQDLQSVIAYLRSDAPEVAPSQKSQPACRPTFLAKLLCRVLFKPLPYPEAPIVAPPMEDKVAHGRYLVTAKLDCNGCHNPGMDVKNIMTPEKAPGFLSGGVEFTTKEGEVIYSRNLTPDPETGLGKWTEEQFGNALRFGQHPSGRPLRAPMVPFAALTEEEASTIWAFLQTIPAIKNDVDALGLKAAVK